MPPSESLNDGIGDEDEQHIGDDIATLPHSLQLVVQGVGVKQRASAMFILRHLVHANITGHHRMQIDPNTFAPSIDGETIHHANFTELLNVVLRRPPPNVTDEQRDRMRERLDTVPGLWPFVRLLSAIGIPVSLIPNPLIVAHMREHRRSTV